MYHSVSLQASPNNLLAISSETFDRQMRFLKIHHYNVIPLKSLSDLIKAKKQLPAKTICLTLDDGYKDNYIYAFPVLKQYNLPATVFIITNEVGRADRLSWEEIKQMQDSGIITFGSHCLGPEPLTKINSLQEVKREIFDSKKVLEEKLGVEVNAFSYPEGRFNSKIRQLVIDAGYKLAVSTNPGKKFANDDIFALKRLRMSLNCANSFIFLVETSGYYNYFREKRHKK
jgi:peptidoglycan/xylan/chitin deacetylase (PgdA/CDA1 family)